MKDNKENTADQLVHYGKLLKANMEEQKATHAYVMQLLGYKAHETLNKRFEDAKFSYDEIRILKEKGLL